MRKYLKVVLLIACTLTFLIINGCGSSSKSNNSPGGGDADSDTDADADGDAATDGDADGDADLTVKICVTDCSDVSTCVQKNPIDGGILDENNYECSSDNYCVYKGCLNTDECKAQYPQTHTDKYACFDGACFAYKCQQTSECTGVASKQTLDANNWKCAQGVCQWIGCNDDNECKADYPNTYNVCYKGDTTVPPFCAKSCTDTSQCIKPDAGVLGDQNNWNCHDSICMSLGCRTDQECQETNLGDRCVVVVGK